MSHPAVAPHLRDVETIKESARAAMPGLDAESLSDLDRVVTATHNLQELLQTLAALSMRERSPKRVRHDIRTPLNHILGYGEMIQDGLYGHPHSREGAIAKASVDAILAAGRRVLKGIDRTVEEVLGPDHGATPLPAAARIPPPPAVVRASETSGRILAADDNPDNLALLRRHLEPAGHDVVTASNGREALELLHQQPFDLVLLDLVMPELDGIGVLTAMKADATLRHLPVVVVTGLNDLNSAVRCIQLGAADHLAKPYQPTLLMARVGACLEAKRLRDQQVEALQRIEEERARANELLRVILPEQIVKELEHTSSVRPRRYENVAVLFSDIVGFIKYCDQRQPEDVLPQLQALVERYELAMVEHHMQKIKTIGDGYMAVAGLLKPVDNPVLQAVRCGMAMAQHAKDLDIGWTVRIGIHVGPVVAGVLGRRQFQFDLWGDTVNTASRVESNGIADGIALSPAAWDALQPFAPHGRSLGEVEMKGKGAVELTQFLGFG